MWRWKKYSWVGLTSWYHCVAEDSMIPKMPVINPLQAHVDLQTQKSYPAWNQTFQNLPFLVNRSADLELWISVCPRNWWVSQLQKSKFAVLDLGFENLGLGLDNCGRTTKNAYRRIYSPWIQQAWNVDAQIFSEVRFGYHVPSPNNNVLRVLGPVNILILRAKTHREQRGRSSPQSCLWALVGNGTGVAKA